MKSINCRICKNNNLTPIISLGDQYLTGVFPKSKTDEITKGELGIAQCENCELVQLTRGYDLNEMYGDNYGYRSGLNKFMVNHLNHKVASIQKKVSLNPDDLVIDIGSNDSTTLQAYNSNIQRVGIDPTGEKFKEYYPEDILLIADFFSKEVFRKHYPTLNAKIITSIAMFYDLEDPSTFVNDIESCLDEEGIWHFEQSYLLSMLRTNSYDTICHEHLEFYSLKVINNLLEQNGMIILDVEMNDINGGSFAVTACKKESKLSRNRNEAVINWMLNQENQLVTKEYLQNFKTEVEYQKKSLLELLNSLKKSGKKVFGYGASTKGNVLLQYCNIGTDLIEYIVEVNTDKYGCFTPGTNIPIISDEEAKKLNPDYYLVLPWHFKTNILPREIEFRQAGGKFIFPLPFVEIV